MVAYYWKKCYDNTAIVHYVVRSNMRALLIRTVLTPGEHVLDGEYEWGRLRQAIIDMLLDNPDITEARRSEITFFTANVCMVYQSYCVQMKSCGFVDTWEVIGELASKSRESLLEQSDQDPRYSVLRQIYDATYLESLNTIFERLGNPLQCDKPNFPPSQSQPMTVEQEQEMAELRRWVQPVEELLVAFAIADEELYQCIVKSAL